MKHLHAVKGVQAFGYLPNDAAHRVKVWLGIVPYPLRQSLAFNELHHHVQVVVLTLLCAGFEHMRIVNAPGYPLLKHESFQISRITLQID